MPRYHAERRNQHWNGDVQDLQCLGIGVSGVVFKIDDRKAIKIHLGTPESIVDFRTEREVYRHFESKRGTKEDSGKKRSEEHWNKYVLRCLDTENPKGLVFERCEETLRHRLRRMIEKERAREALRWAKQVAMGLQWIHECNVIQGDVGCHNMLLDSANNLKLADFAGSSINGSRGSANYEVRNRLPGVGKPNKTSDIFALGSAIYEIATGHPPYEKLSYNTIQSMYRRGEFPKDVNGIPVLGKIIRKCWERQFESARDVVRCIGELDPQYRRTEAVVGSEIPIQPPLKVIDVEGTPSSSRRHRITYVQPSTQQRYRTPHRRDAELVVKERHGKKKSSQGPIRTWVSRSIHLWKRPGGTAKQYSYY